MTERIRFQAKNGEPLEGELAMPSGTAPAPSIVLIQEWWGVNAHMKDVAERLAREGFLVLCPDLYRGKLTKDADEAGRLMNALDFDQAMSDIDGAAAHLRAHARSNKKVAVMGFCMGGALSFGAACRIEGLDAIVPFYGIPDASKVDYGKVQAPILAHFAKRDAWAKPEGAQALKADLEGRGRSMRLELYDADHAFFNDTRPEVYAESEAKRAWATTLEFLRKHLG